MYNSLAYHSRAQLFLLLFICVVAHQVKSQDTPLPGMRGTPANIPDVSLVGDMCGKLSDDTNDNDRNKIFIREIEFALQGYLYPEMRADAIMAFHRHGDHVEAEICEGYVSFFNILGGFNLIAGKRHIDFGKVNKPHQHHVPYVDRALVLTQFFGEHEFAGEGASLDFLLPLPFYLQIAIGAWQAGHEHAHDEDHAEAGDQFSLADNMITSRMWASFALGDHAELEVGGSGLAGHGPHHEDQKDDVLVLGTDLTLKMWPSTYQRLLLQAEILRLQRELPDERLERWGCYAFCGYRFSKYWDAGLRYDWAQNALPDEDLQQKLVLVATNSLTETTKVRLQYGFMVESHTNEALLQLIFGIGPHSHPLE